MDLYFSRRRFFETSFYARCGKSVDSLSDLTEVYRVSTTVRKRSIFPDITTIEYVAPEDRERHSLVAKIEWRWPSQIASVIEIDGKRLVLQDFLKRDGSLRPTSTGTHLTIGEELFTWRSAVFRPAHLYDSRKRPVAWYIPRIHDLRPLSRALSVQPGCLHLEPDVAADSHARDFIVASFFVYRAWRDLRVLFTPWWSREQADFTGIRAKDQENEDEESARLTGREGTALG